MHLSYIATIYATDVGALAIGKHLAWQIIWTGWRQQDSMRTANCAVHATAAIAPKCAALENERVARDVSRVTGIVDTASPTWARWLEIEGKSDGGYGKNRTKILSGTR